MKLYTVVLQREAEGGYSVTVPDLPGCASQGETKREALRNIREAIECYIEGLAKLGRRAPDGTTTAETVRVRAA